MPDHEFLFALRLCEDGRFEEMLRELTMSVLEHVGFGAVAAAELCSQVLAGVSDGEAAGAACDVRFRAHAGEIEIIVSVAGRQIVRASRRLP